MANIKSAKKRIVQNEIRRMRNRGSRTRMRTAVKHLRAAIAAGDAEKARELLPETLRLVDSTVKKNFIHANAAARTKSRLIKGVGSLAS